MKRKLFVLIAAFCLLAFACDPAAAFEQGRWDSRRFTDIANDTSPDLGGNLNTAGFYVYCDGMGPVYINDNLRVTGTVTVDDSAATPPLNLTERATAPTTPASGDIYLDDGTNTTTGNPGLRRYTGAAWEDIDVFSVASDAECVTGTEAGKVVTPAGLTARLAAPGAIGGTTPATSIKADSMIIGGLTLAAGLSSVADDASITLATGVAGFGFAQAGDNEQWMQFAFTAAGAVSVIANSALAVNTDSDGCLCVYDAGTGIAIKNRLGGTKTIRYSVYYSL